MYQFETIAKAFPAPTINVTTEKETEKASNTEKLTAWIAAAKTDESWHNNTLKAVGHLVSKGLSDSAIHALLDSALTRPGYTPDQTHAEIQKMIDGAKKWDIDAEYDAGDTGPIPLGYTKEGNFALRDQGRSIIISATSNQLLSQQSLMALADSAFWASKYPSQKGLFNAYAAGEALIAACRKRGPFNPMKVRGRGIWLEGDREIINFGSPVPPDVGYHYLCFEPIPIQKCDEFDTKRLLNFLEHFNWQNPQDAMLLLGWLAIAPICGALRRRPHGFISGPPRCGKTTIHNAASDLLYPLVISADGQSSEAGLRQGIGPDSLPVIIDEFESDHNQNRLRSVLKLTRSSYSAETPLFRGTPEGRAMQFSLRTIFLFAAVNPLGMEPADETRFIMFELNAHDSDEFTARLIAEDEEYFSDKGPQWCGYMAGHAGKINPAIKTFHLVMPSMDSRHRDNMATLLAGAFVASHGREPTQSEASGIVAEYSGTIKMHGKGLDRDDSHECLNHIFAHIVEQDTLGQWLAAALNSLRQKKNDSLQAKRILSAYGLKINVDGGKAGLYIQHGAPNLEKIFSSTKWGARAWQRALRKIVGAFSPENPVYFSGAGKSRCVVLPLDLIPEPDEAPGQF
jgi:hypothetical protein